MRNFDPKKPYQDLPLLPPQVDFDDVDLLKLVNKANNSLYELKGAAHLLPNGFILISPLSVREAVESSGIENIVTTVADALRADIIYDKNELKGAEKEILNYRDALLEGFRLLQKDGFLNTNSIIQIQSILEPNKKGIRNIPDVALRNSRTREVRYTPPEGPDIIRDKMKNLEDYFNNIEEFDDIDPLIRAAVIHYQFEAIHPFFDGNGRTGRMLIVLYLVKVGRLDLPILFLSKYILENQEDYYKLLLEVTSKNNWREWVIYLLKGIDKQAQETKEKIIAIKDLMSVYKNMEVELGKAGVMSGAVIDYLFSNAFYTQQTMSLKLGVHRNTAAKYFSELEILGVVKKFKYKRENIYYNETFIKILNY